MGECRRWLHGASRLFAPQALEAVWLCPDCSWEWVRIVSTTPSLASPGRNEVHLLMVALGPERCPGAGASFAVEEREGQSGLRRCQR